LAILIQALDPVQKCAMLAIAISIAIIIITAAIPVIVARNILIEKQNVAL
jgi:hypothetical protein